MRVSRPVLREAVGEIPRGLLANEREFGDFYQTMRLIGTLFGSIFKKSGGAWRSYKV